jgi:bacterioferritin (cytochrome b1)
MRRIVSSIVVDRHVLSNAVGENVPEALGCDLKLELAAHPLLKEAIAHCECAGDYVSRELIREVGLQNHLQSQMS